MKIHLVTFYNTKHEDVFKPGAEKLKSSISTGKVDTFKCYTEKQLKITYDQMQFLKSNERGFGFWAWKSSVILQRLLEVDNNDVVIYHDCGRSFYNYSLKNDVRPFANYVVDKHGGIGVALSHWHHDEYTKKECFEVMGCTDDFYYKSHQAVATWHVWQKTPLTIKFLQEWKYWCFHPSRIITDDSAEKENQKPGFHGHRHDQSILTNLLLKYSKEYSEISPIFQEKGFWEKNINYWIENKKSLI